MNVEIVPFDTIFLDKSWLWLKDEEVKRLTNSPDFTKESQINWYNSLSQRKDFEIWGVKADGYPIGVCGLKGIIYNECEYWGYIGEKTYWGKGIGKTILQLMEEKAKEKGIKIIFLKVIKDNDRAYNLYIKSGYLITEEIGSLIVMKKHI